MRESDTERYWRYSKESMAVTVGWILFSRRACTPTSIIGVQARRLNEKTIIGVQARRLHDKLKFLSFPFRLYQKTPKTDRKSSKRRKRRRLGDWG